MSLKKYLKAIAGTGAVSESAFYTTLATNILSSVLHYEPAFYEINKSNKAGGIPDIRLHAGDEDKTEWIVCEAKLDDADIRNEKRRQRIWKEQILARGYIRTETFYVLLCAPKTFYVCNLDGETLDGVHIEPDELLDIKTNARLSLTDENLRALLERITFEASMQRPQYELFRQGDLPGGYLTISTETIGNLQDTFDFALRHLKAYCADVFDTLKQEYREASAQLATLEKKLESVGSDAKLRRPIQANIRRLKRKGRLVLQLFEIDYPQFKHDQTYAGTEKEEHFEDIFITNTAYVALSRLFFVRICEDIGLTTRKVSHEGPSIWRRFVDHIKWRYQDLVEVAYKDVAHIYSQLFEETVFDWYGYGNGKLNDILERILYRLNAFSFQNVSRDVLGSIYQYFRPKTERKRLGEYYTSEEAVDYILKHTGIAADAQLMTKRILDPSCGSFTFGVRALAPLLQVSAHLSAENRIELVRNCLVGYDINPFSVFLAHLSLLFSTLDLYLEAKQHNANFRLPKFSIFNRNSLTYFSQFDELEGFLEDEESSGGDKNEQVDYVVGNPPFVRNERLPLEDRDALDQLFAAIKSGNTDLSAYFLYYAMKYWLKDGGTLGMVAPIGNANTEMAAQMRRYFRDYSIYQIVSLEWMAKDIFPDADIIPMLIFARKERPTQNHAITIVSGLRNKSELQLATSDANFFATHSSSINYQRWLELSPTSDWTMEVKAEDVPILEKMKKCAVLGTITKSTFAIKLGAAAKVTHAYRKERNQPQELPFLKGQHISSFHYPLLHDLTEADEVIDTSRIKQVSDASIWRDLSFYLENAGKPDETGLGCYDYKGQDLVNNNNPSDTLCCFVPNIYVTLVAAAGNPLEVCANNSVVLVIPFKYSAHVISAIINSRISRYYAFLLLRASVLLRRRAHWNPRTLKNLPLPELTDAQAKQLHLLAKEAAALSQDVQVDELDAYQQLMAQCHNTIKAGFLNLRWTGETIDRDDLPSSRVMQDQLQLGTVTISGEPEALCLLQLALLALDKEEIPAADLQNILLPQEAVDRARLAAEINGLADHLRDTKQRMEAIGEEIDEIVASGLGLTPAEHDIIRHRCQQFPLSVTVERPRYVWSPDRKRQARRIYQPGERFK
ncbi:MAG: N-6 DNA methylase [Acidobacteria bacterium]|nr:N-6 DNA methylase [Acidobacteriota bacterium]